MGDRIQFDDFTLDIRAACLRHRRQEVHLTPKALHLLQLLLSRQGQLITKDQILESVWGDVVVSDSAIFSCIRELRRALGDNAQKPRYIETVHRRGYRFRDVVMISEDSPAAVTVPGRLASMATQAAYDKRTIRREVSAHSSAKRVFSLINFPALLAGALLCALLIYGYLLQSDRDSGPALPNEPSIAVLPFDNMSDDPEQNYFADGITEDLITDLSQLRGLFVIDRHSTFTYKHQVVGARQIGRELGVRFLLEGSVRRSRDRVRATAQLIDANSGDHLWAARYDRPMADIFNVQDEIRHKIIAALDVKLSEGEQSRVWRKTTDNPDAYVLFLQARELYLRFDASAIQQSITRLEQALELDPRFSAAYAMLGWCFETLPLWAESPEQERDLREKAFEYAGRALSLHETLPVARSLLAALLLAEGQSDRAYREGKEAVSLSPNSAKALAVLSVYASSVGRYEEALSAITRAMRINPHPPDWYFFVLGRAYTFNGQFEEAIAVLEKCAAQLPDYLNCRYEATIALAASGRMDEAAAEAQEVLRINPSFSSTSKLKWIKEPAIREQHGRWLSVAGLPD